MRIAVLERLGGPAERIRCMTARDPAPDDIAAPVAVALDGADLPAGVGLPRGFGLPDDAFAHDGQITKRAIRAVTLSALAPRPGELLWDIGAGSGSVSVEWCLNGGQAIAIEPRADRIGNIAANIEAFGLAGRMRAVHGAAPDALAGLPARFAHIIEREIGAPAFSFEPGIERELVFRQIWQLVPGRHTSPRAET